MAGETVARQAGDRAVTQRVIDAVTANVAILDGEGTIEMVNAAWSAFGAANGAPDDAGIGPGANYFRACRPDDVTDGDFAQRAIDGIRAVLARELPVFTLEYPCHGGGKERWFVLLAAPLGDSGAMITHVDVSAAHTG